MPLGAGWARPASRSSAGWRSASMRLRIGVASTPAATRSPCSRVASTCHIRASTRGCTSGSRRSGAIVSEMPPGGRPFKWSFPARNRIMAGLADMVVLVEAADPSGSLITAEFARDLGRAVGAVPGRITARMAAGTNGLLRDGAIPVTGARDVLDELFGAGVGAARAAEASEPADATLRGGARCGGGGRRAGRDRGGHGAGGRGRARGAGEAGGDGPGRALRGSARYRRSPSCDDRAYPQPP